MNRRVVVTGMGAITPLGNDVDSFWSNVKNGSCGIKRISRFDTEQFDSKIDAEVAGFDPQDYMDKK
jgi:3-oxoacyl-[acyl-carrier-protein] synthase II